MATDTKRSGLMAKLLRLEARFGISRLFTALYRRLGARYPRVIVIGMFPLSFLAILVGVGLLALYQPMSTGEFLLVLGVCEVLMVLEVGIMTVVTWRRLSPVHAWLKGDRTKRRTVDAWEAIANLPGEYMRQWTPISTAVTCAPAAVAIPLVLGLPWWSIFILFAAACVILLYGTSLRVLLAELALRPVMHDVAIRVPDDTPFPEGGISVATKLLIGLPIINVITGVVVAGLSAAGALSGVSDLGLDIAVAVVVAFTLSLELTALLSRSILVPVADLEQATEAVSLGDLTTRVPVMSGDELGRLTRSFNTMAAGLQERERLTEAFGAFVDPEIGRRVLEEGTVLETQEVEVTVMFIDIRDFTAFAEQASARETVARLNEYFELVVPVLSRHGGHANKFLGDGLLGVFGAPAPHLDHANRAMAAALEIVELVAEHFHNEVQVGIGVNSGEVVAGTIGGGGRLEFTVIGDPVNTAARVEGATRETGDPILITGSTLARLTRSFGGFDARPNVELRGKAEQVDLYAPRKVADLWPRTDLSAPQIAAEMAAAAGQRLGPLGRMLRQ